MKALFIGRFQPFHNGHLKIVQNISKKYDEIIIGIGSSQYENTLDNPFSYDERNEMIKESLENNGITNYKIILIPDIHNPPKWVSHVVSIIPDFDIVVSNSSFTKNLFLEKDYDVEGTPLYNKEECSGKEIRKRIMNDEKWAHLVPKEVEVIIENIDGVKRLKELSKD
jgi:nicotinamide-nucleotide adenylyltransferase